MEINDLLTDPEVQAALKGEFGDKSPDYVQGFIDGITQATQALVDDAMVSLMATIPLRAYLEEFKGEPPSDG